MKCPSSREIWKNFIALALIMQLVFLLVWIFRYDSAKETTITVLIANVPVPKVDIPVPKADIPVPKADVPVPKVDIPVLKADVPVHKVDVPIPMADIPVPKADVPVPKADVPVPKADVPKKLFVYLVQTEQCIPEELKTNELFGNPDECMCDVIVFGFKDKCLDSAPSHVEHINSNTATSLNEGRNTLYTVARSRNINYLYYIFLNDDPKFSYNEKYTPPEMKSIPPLRSFEHFLINLEPAVGVLNYINHHNADETIQSYQRICSPHIKSSETLPSNRTVIGDKMPLYLTVVHFDAMVNAFHRDAAPALLPYTTAYDQIDWWHSQRDMIIRVEFRFRGQAVMFTPVTLDNSVHRPYPQKTPNSNELWRMLITEVVKDVPDKFANEKCIQEFLDNPLAYCEDISRAYCFTYPPKHPIKKYSHFLENWSLD